MLIIGWIVFGLGALFLFASIGTGVSSKRTYPESEDESHEASAIFAYLAVVLLIVGALLLYTAMYAVDITKSSVTR